MYHILHEIPSNHSITIGYQNSLISENYFCKVSKIANLLKVCSLKFLYMYVICQDSRDLAPSGSYNVTLAIAYL